jgi:subtilase family serine protease
MMKAAESVINQGVGDVMVLGIPGQGENSFPGVSSGNDSSVLNLRYALTDAYAHHVTVLSPSGDTGATGYTTLEPPYAVYRYRVNSWPASDPLVTAVGGTALHLSNNGNRLSPDVAWNDVYGASGGGESAVFSRPQYQNAVAGVVGNHRGTPDISLTAAAGGWGYYSFAGAGGAGWHIYAGTSEATPIMAGIVALAEQLAGHRLGLINPALYKLGELHQAGAKGTGIVSVTSGTNTFDGVTGYHAGPGFNMVTGWGTIDAAQFVPALARLG